MPRNEQHAAESGPNGVWPVLAGMRFFFAIWVLFDHTYNFAPHDRAMPILSGSGLMPVMCFLVISGYSIHHSIMDQPSGYFARRFWRVAPTNFVAVGLALSAYLLFGPTLFNGYGNPSALPGFFPFLTYLLSAQCFFTPSIGALFPAWSLSIEVVYYALAPLLLRASDKTLFIITAVSSSCFAAWNYLPTAIAPRYVADATNGVGIVVFAWAWVVGWLAHKAPGGRLPLFLLFSGVGCFCALLQPYGFQLYDLTANISTYGSWIVTMAVVFFGFPFGLPKPLKNMLTYLGDLSFPLYLLHYPVLYASVNSVWKVRPEWNYGIFEVLISLGSAVLVLHFCDRPLRRSGQDGSYESNRIAFERA